jgi:Bifunctional DNA primase/polymerase, N-terminal
MTNNGDTVLDWLHSLLGNAVLIPIPLKTKGPVITGWQTLTRADSQSLRPELLAAVQRDGNIGVMLGPASDRLLAVDLDDDALVDKWLAEHPWLVNTLRSRGRRGCQFWLRLEDDCDYPNGKAVYRLPDSHGEIRLGGAGGAQSVIFGQHPDGMRYQVEVEKPPLEVSLADLDELAGCVLFDKKETNRSVPICVETNNCKVSTGTDLNERVRRYMAKVPASIEGQNGDDQLFRAASILVNGWGLVPEEAFSFLAEYNQRAEPPWPEQRLRYKLKEAQDNPGDRLRGYLLQRDTQTNATIRQRDYGQSSNVEQDPEDLIKGLDIYYDSTKDFWATNDRAGWIKIGSSDVRRWLAQRGFRSRPKDDENVSQIDSLLTAIQRSNDVDYAGPLAGYPAGVFVINNSRILVKDSPVLIQPSSGPWPLLRGIIENMLGLEQSVFLFGWLKVALESLASRKFRVGQAMTLAGPKDCGKSLIQQLITILLGGRAAKPHRYMSGATPFNADLFGSEHLMVEDEEPSTDIRARRNFGTKIKEICANTVHSCHAKHRSALSLTPFWRVSISVNDEPENLMILPPIDESLADKLIILKAARYPMPMSTATDEERSLFMAALKSELPHFADFLFKWQIPADLVSQRYGVTHYQHPEILTALGTLAPETRLLELIDSELFSSVAPGSWEGTASELERKLTADNSSVRREAGKLFSFPTACGTYLGRLQKLYPGRFESMHSRTGNRWTIDPPTP